MDLESLATFRLLRQEQENLAKGSDILADLTRQIQLNDPKHQPHVASGNPKEDLRRSSKYERTRPRASHASYAARPRVSRRRV